MRVVIGVIGRGGGLVVWDCWEGLFVGLLLVIYDEPDVGASRDGHQGARDARPRVTVGFGGPSHRGRVHADALGVPGGARGLDALGQEALELGDGDVEVL